MTTSNEWINAIAAACILRLRRLPAVSVQQRHGGCAGAPPSPISTDQTGGTRLSRLDRRARELRCLTSVRQPTKGSFKLGSVRFVATFLNPIRPNRFRMALLPHIRQ